jgi:hypothetical protein
MLIQRNKGKYYMGREQHDGLGIDPLPVTGLEAKVRQLGEVRAISLVRCVVDDLSSSK